MNDNVFDEFDSTLYHLQFAANPLRIFSMQNRDALAYYINKEGAYFQAIFLPKWKKTTLKLQFSKKESMFIHLLILNF